ncbi:MAG: 4-hydroxy-tetrahydrodipicolinate reductase [Planctomycetota bacterium]|nr:MAG: 4-hydroxy-tetrahydrodipicolinate reductase [Planctomycetota bacterium]
MNETERPIRLLVNGAAGRMGQRIVALASTDRAFRLAAAVDAPGHPAVGRDAGELAGIGTAGVVLQAEVPDEVHADVVIDFSTPAGLLRILEVCLRRGWPLVAATTGLEPEQRQQVEAAAERIPLIWAPNMSLAVNVGFHLAREAARWLKAVPSGVDVEIIERHHRFKVDAPSGTALRFGEIIAGQMGQTRHVHGRHGRPGPRPRDEIGYHALRVGDNVGEHTIVFGMIGETLELTVRGHTRDSYAYGALAAAKFLVGKPPGRYTMDDVLGLGRASDGV